MNNDRTRNRRLCLHPKFRDALSALGFTTTDDVFGLIMARFDVDGDGCVDYSEFLRFFMPKVNGMRWNGMQWNPIQSNAIRSNPMEHNGTQWNGMARGTVTFARTPHAPLNARPPRSPAAAGPLAAPGVVANVAARGPFTAPPMERSDGGTEWTGRRSFAASCFFVTRLRRPTPTHTHTQTHTHTHTHNARAQALSKEQLLDMELSEMRSLNILGLKESEKASDDMCCFDMPAQ